MACSFKYQSIPELDFSSAVGVSGLFYNATNAYPYLTTLGGFKNLGKAYLTTQSSNYQNYTLNLSVLTALTHDSLMNIINDLYDIASAGVQTQTLSLGNTNRSKLTAEEIAIATNKGWTVS